MNLNFKIHRVADFKLFVFLGKISYGLYLYHNFIPVVMRNLCGIERKNKFMPALLPNLNSPIYQLIIQVFLLLMVSVMSWYLIEKPFLRFKKLNY